jgi:gamma-glutamylcyclotransferase (GGCT)/AIG2-like uncharacterized protein YtfP
MRFTICQVAEYLFVYGTLRGEFDNPCAKKLRSEARSIGPASVRGSLFHVDRYPGYRSEPGGTVSGELYLLTDPAGTLPVLDRYEGPEFRRVRVTVSTGHEAWAYEYASEPRPSTRIESGDFLKP